MTLAPGLQIQQREHREQHDEAGPVDGEDTRELRRRHRQLIDAQQGNEERERRREQELQRVDIEQHDEQQDRVERRGPRVLQSARRKKMLCLYQIHVSSANEAANGTKPAIRAISSS